MLAAWTSSPTRLREDAAAEADLVAGGYRNRVITELMQNAADAATRIGIDGHAAVWAESSSLHIANVGEPLTESGVQALAALRASDKGAGAVGRYGVGFTAVRAVTEKVEIRSTTGSIVFDGNRTREEVAARGIVSDGPVPGLRLPWPVETSPSTGWDTEIVLHDVVDAAAVAHAALTEAVDLLLELIGLTSITLGDKETGHRVTRTTARGPGAWDEVTIGERRWWCGVTSAARWYLPLETGPVQAGRDVLRAPTRSDEALDLPMLLVADVALQPDRRRVLPGADLAAVTAGYGALVADLPPEHRYLAVPRPGLPASPVDAELRAALDGEISSTAWVPTVAGPPVRPERAAVIEYLSTELAEVLVDVVPGLVVPESSDNAASRALIAAGATRLGLADIVEASAAASREPAWWHRLYAALDDIVRDAADAQECAALPVPLTDGRTVTGPRTTVLVDAAGLGSVGWARVVHPEAAHPLLARLGAQTARPADLLSDPALAQLLDGPDPASDDLVEEVLAVARVLADSSERADGNHAAIAGIGSLTLSTEDGDVRAADELLLPDSPLLEVLETDHPFGVVASSVVDRVGAAALRIVGVGWGFGVVTDELPVGPDHDLDDESAWWNSVPGGPGTVTAIRDLDLVDPERWARALTLIVSEPDTADVLSDRAGYTAWWLRRHAVLGGVPLGMLRAPDDRTFEGLLDAADHPDAHAFRSALAGTLIDDADTAADLLAAAADTDRTVVSEVSIRMYAALAEAVDTGRVDLRDLEPPDSVRTLAGTVADAADVVVVDHPRWIAVLPAERAVMGSPAHAEVLADLLDVDTASTAIEVDVLSVGERTAVAGHPVLAAVRSLWDIAIPDAVTVHSELRVRCRPRVETGSTQDAAVVPLWITGDGEVHLSRSVFP